MAAIPKTPNTRKFSFDIKIKEVSKITFNLKADQKVYETPLFQGLRDNK